MLQQQIIPVGNAAALPLPADVLDALGIKVGDAVNVTIVGRQLVIQPLDDAGEQKRYEAIVDDVFERRRSAYQKLAEGHR